MRVAAIIMAAGESSRLGKPKQLVSVGGKTLLDRAISAAKDGGCIPVVVVVGAHAQAIAGNSRRAVEVIRNEDWHLGLGTSIRAGLRHVVQNHPSIEAVILMTCDQPFVARESLRRIIEAQGLTSRSIVAAEYSGTLGVPALFLRSEFGKLDALQDDEGAKRILLAQDANVAKVPMPEAAEDIDTPAQLAHLRKEEDGIRQTWK